MKRPEEVEEALDWIGNESCCEIILNYIRSLEQMVDTAYKTLEELDEIV